MSGACMRKLTQLLLIIFAAALWASGSAMAKSVGATLQPQNEQQFQACQLLIQGSQLLKLKKPFQARPLFEKAAALWPDSAHVHFNMGVCFSEIGDFPRALQEYELTLRYDPRLTECIPNIASCYQLMGQPMQAIQFFEEYLRKNAHPSDEAEIRGMINALKRQAGRQIQSSPTDVDYLSAVMPSGKLQRWQREKLPLKVYISNGTDEKGQPVRGFQENYNEVLLDALNTWVKASNYHLSYQLVEDAQRADIVCSWTDKRDFLERGNSVEQGVARVASRPSPNGREDEIGHARVIILILDPEGHNVSDDVLKKACLHEVAHALGFAGHSTNNKDIMFFSDSPTVWASLTKRDRATMERMYQDYPQFYVQDANGIPYQQQMSGTAPQRF